MTTIYPHQLTAIVKLLVATGDKLEARGDRHWIVAAHAASAVESILLRQAMHNPELACDIDKAAAAMHQAGNTDAEIAFLLASTILDARRLGLINVDTYPAPRWLGIDMAKPGKDTTFFRGDCHA